MSESNRYSRAAFNEGLPLFMGLEPAPYTSHDDLFGDWRFTCEHCPHVSAYVPRQTKAWALARDHAQRLHRAL